jgi:flagellar hook assembly protein FlgD
VPEVGGSPARVASIAAPNPFTDRTSIELRLANAGTGTVSIYSSDGREVRRMTMDLPQGESSVEWDGRDGAGSAVPSGAYFYRVTTPAEEAKGLIIRSN